MAIKKTTPTEQNLNIVHTKVVITQNQRGRIDIAKYLTAIREAESATHPSRANLYDIYEHRLLDGHLKGIVGRRINSVLNKSLLFKDKDGSVVEELNNLIQSKTFRKIMKAIMESVFWGISGLEFIPGPIS